MKLETKILLNVSLRTFLKLKLTLLIYLGNPVLRREHIDDKLGILDVVAKLDDTYYCDIEMQMGYSINSTERILKYWSSLYSRQIKSSENYGKLQKVIVVFIANFNFPNFKHLPFMSTWSIRENKYNTTILTDKLEIRIIELPKIINNIDDNNELMDWLLFLENPKSNRVIEKMKVNKELKQANEKLKEIYSDEQLEHLIELRQRYILERNSDLDESREAGRAEGRAEGIAEVAKRMLEKGLKLEDIVDVTGLSKSEIESLI